MKFLFAIFLFNACHVFATSKGSGSYTQNLGVIGDQFYLPSSRESAGTFSDSTQSINANFIIASTAIYNLAKNYVVANSTTNSAHFLISQQTYLLNSGSTHVVVNDGFWGMLFLSVGGSGGPNFNEGCIVYLGGNADTTASLAGGCTVTCGSPSIAVCYSATDDSYRIINNSPTSAMRIGYSLIGNYGD